MVKINLSALYSNLLKYMATGLCATGVGLFLARFFSVLLPLTPVQPANSEQGLERIDSSSPVEISTLPSLFKNKPRVLYRWQGEMSRSRNLDGLTLVGTVEASPELSSAVIMHENKTREYSTGDKIGPAILKKIERGKVKLAIGPEIFIASTDVALKTEKRPTTPQEESAGNHVILSRSKINDCFGGQIKKCILGTTATPHLVNNKMAGIVMKRLMPSSMLYEFGFRKNDIILSLNGFPLNSVEASFELLNEARQANNMRIKFKRQGKIRTRTFHIRN